MSKTVRIVFVIVIVVLAVSWFALRESNVELDNTPPKAQVVAPAPEAPAGVTP